MNLEKIIEKIEKKLNNLKDNKTDYQISLLYFKGKKFSFETKGLTKVSHEVFMTLSGILQKNGKTASFSITLDEENIDKTLSEIDNVAIVSNQPLVLPESEQKDELSDLTLDLPEPNYKEFENLIPFITKDNISIERTILAENNTIKILWNSKNLRRFQKRNSTYAWASLVKKSSNSSGWGVVAENDNLINSLLKAKKQLLLLENSSPIKTGTYKVLFSPEVALDILEYLTSQLDGYKILSKTSALIGKLGSKIASPKLTIIENPNILPKEKKFIFDGEGLDYKKKFLIFNGELMNYLGDTFTASKLAITPGNKSRFTSCAPVGIYTPPTDSKNEILNSDEVILEVLRIKNVGGINPLANQFSVGAEGILWKAGKIIQPVSQITVAIKFWDLLKNIIAVCDDLNYELGNNIVGSLLVDNVTVAGK